MYTAVTQLIFDAYIFGPSLLRVKVSLALQHTCIYMYMVHTVHVHTHTPNGREDIHVHVGFLMFVLVPRTGHSSSDCKMPDILEARPRQYRVQSAAAADATRHGKATYLHHSLAQ